MNCRTFLAIIAVVACCAGAPVLAQNPSPAVPQSGTRVQTLAEAHLANKMTCASCHKDEANPSAVDESACIGCHGNLEKMADASEGKFDVNPHAPHGAKIACLRCHKGHKEFENYCNKCHEFAFKRK